jgi:hypothetical protein
MMCQAQFLNSHQRDAVQLRDRRIPIAGRRVSLAWRQMRSGIEEPPRL